MLSVHVTVFTVASVSDLEKFLSKKGIRGLEPIIGDSVKNYPC